MLFYASPISMVLLGSEPHLEKSIFRAWSRGPEVAVLNDQRAWSALLHTLHTVTTPVCNRVPEAKVMG
jgi:hypothetical protein